MDIHMSHSGYDASSVKGTFGNSSCGASRSNLSSFELLLGFEAVSGSAQSSCCKRTVDKSASPLTVVARTLSLRSLFGCLRLTSADAHHQLHPSTSHHLEDERPPFINIVRMCKTRPFTQLHTQEHVRRQQLDQALSANVEVVRQSHIRQSHTRQSHTYQQKSSYKA
eukprot:3892855-Amphidinium_carterae.2